MNDNIEYIIRIVLKARDEMSAALGEAAAELALFEDHAGQLDKRLETVNKRMETFNKRGETMGRRLDALKQQGAGADQIFSALVGTQDKLEESTTQTTEAIDSQSKAEARAIVTRNRSTRSKEANTKATKDEREETALSKRERAAYNEELIKAARAAGQDTEAVGKLTEQLKELREQAKLTKRELGNKPAQLAALKRMPDQDPAYVKAREAEVEALQAAHDKAIAAREAKREEIAAVSEANRVKAAEARAQAARDEIETESGVEEAVSKTVAAKHSDTEATVARTRAIDEDTTAKRRNAKATEDEAVAEDKVVKAKAKRPRKRPSAPKKTETVVEEVVPTVDPEADAKAAEVEAQRLAAAEGSARKRGRAAAKAEEAAFNDEIENLLAEDHAAPTHHEDDPYIGGFGLGGGAAAGGGKEEAIRKHRERADRDERKRLDELVLDYDRLRGRIGKLFTEFRSGDRDFESLATHINEIAKGIDQVTRSAARLSIRPATKAADTFASRASELRGMLEEARPAPIRKSEVDPLHTISLPGGNEVIVDTLKKTEVETKRVAAAEDRASNSTRNFGRSVRNARSEIKNVDQDLSRLSQSFQRFAQRASHTGTNVAALDNNLRGLLVLAVLAFAQQFITILDGLVGALGAVASSAVYAAGALGGAFVAGLAQALPVIGLVIASLARLKAVMNVVQQADLVKQQRDARSAASGKKVADTTDAVANAQDGLKAAHDRLAQAQQNVIDKQEALSKARHDAAQQLKDLVRQEQDAELAARGAAISQSDAQAALRQSVATGDVSGLAGNELQVLESDNALSKSRVDLRQSRRDQRTSSVDGVPVQRGVDKAKQDLADARKAVAQANDAITKAERGIDKARRGATAAAADTFAAGSKLAYMLAQLSPAERKLYDAMQTIRATYKANIRPITDIFTNEFTTAVNTGNRLLKDPRILHSARDLATGVSREMDKFLKSFTDNKTINQFTRIWAAGAKNLKPLGDMLRNIGHALVNIAEEAGPSLHRIINWFDGLSKRILNATENTGKMGKFFHTGTDNLLAWLHTMEELVKLFMALVGIGQGSGMSMVQDLGKWAERTTKWIHQNRKDVAEFFDKSKQTLYIVLSVVGELLSAMVGVFDPSRLKGFADFLKQSVIPALVLVVTTVGLASKVLFWLLSQPVASQISTFVVAFLLLSKVVSSTAVAGRLAITSFGNLLLKLEKFPGIGSKITGAFDSVAGGLGRMSTRAGEFLAKHAPRLEGLANKLKGLGAKITGSVENRGVEKQTETAKEAEQVGAAIESAFAAGAKEAAVILREALGTGGKVAATEMRTSVATGGTAAGIAIKKDEVEAGAIAGDEIGTQMKAAGPIVAEEIAAGEMAGGGVPGLPGGRGMSRRRMLGLGAGAIAGTAAFVALSKGPHISEAPQLGGGVVPGRMQLNAQSGQLFGQKLTSFDIGGAFSSLFRNNKGFSKWADEASSSLKRLTDHRDAQGLTDLAGAARKYAKDFPEYADQLNKFADTADQGAKHIANMKRMVDLLGTSLAEFKKLGLSGKDLLDPRASNMFTDNLRRMNLMGFRSIKDLRDNVEFNIGKINKAYKEGSYSWYQAVHDNTGSALKILQKAMNDGSLSVKDGTAEMLRYGNSNMKKLRDNMSSLSQDGKRALGDNMMAAAEAAKKQMERTGTVTEKGMERVRRLMVRGLKTYGFSEEQAVNIQKTGNLSGHARQTKDDPSFSGGAAGGYGQGNAWIGKQGERGKDMVHAVLGRGEYVLNWAKQKYLKARYGVNMSELERVKGLHAGTYEQQGGFGISGYAGGGFANSPGAHVDTPAERRIAEDLARLGRHLGVTFTPAGPRSARRTPGENAAVGGSQTSNHLLGRAMDVAPDIIKTVSNAILNRFGLNRPMPGNWLGTDGAIHDERNHIELLGGGPGGPIGRNMGSGAPAIQRLKQIRGIVIGGGGLAGANAQGAINVNVAAANEVLRRAFDAQSGGGTGGGGTIPAFHGPWVNVMSRIASMRHWNLADWKRLVQGESGGRVGIRNASSGAFGLGQFLGATLTEYAKYGATSSRGEDQIRAMAQYISDRYKTPTNALRTWLSRSPHWYSQGGDVPGKGDGDTVPAMLTPGEHVWTKSEVEAAGGHGVMRMLRSMFGGGKQGGPFRFASGGGVYDPDWARRHIGHYAESTGRNTGPELDRLQKEFHTRAAAWCAEFATTAAMMGGAHKAVRTASVAMINMWAREGTHGFEKGMKRAPKVGDLMTFGNNHVVIVDRVNRKAGTVTTLSGNSNRGDGSVHRVTYGIHEGQYARPDYSSGSGRAAADSAAGLSGQNKRNQEAINRSFTTKFNADRLKQIAKGIYNLPTLPMRGWDGAVAEMARAMSALNRKFKPSNRLHTLDQITRDGGVLDSLEAARERWATALERQLTFAQYAITKYGDKLKSWRVSSISTPIQQTDRALNVARKELRAITTQEGDITGTRSAIQRRLATLRRGGVKQGEGAEVRRLETQLSAIDKQYQEIRDAHASALEKVYQAQVDAQQARIDKTNADAANTAAPLGILGRVASVTGNDSLLAKVNKAQEGVLTKQADDLAKEISRARAMGNNELATQLEQQVADLRTQVFESIQQDIQNAIDVINNAASRRMGRLDLFDRMLNAVGSVGLGGAAAVVGGEAFTRGNLYAQRNNVLQTQRTGLNEQLWNATVQGNGKLIQDLTDQLAENQVAIQENTKAYFDARVSEVNTNAQRLGGDIDLRKQIITLQGAISGTTDNAALLDLEKQRTDVLTQQADSLNALLAEAIQNGDQQAINDLTTQLLQNQVAVLENTQAINELNGTASQPQSFTSTAWQWFREAIFSGMGDVMPSYVVPGAATGGIVTKSGLAYVHSGEPIVPAHIAETTFQQGGDHMEFHMHGIDGNIDYTELASTVAWAKKTAQP